jgi:hypothetical protein
MTRPDHREPGTAGRRVGSLAATATGPSPEELGEAVRNASVVPVIERTDEPAVP